MIALAPVERTFLSDLGRLTDFTFDAWRLSGRSNAKARVALLSGLRGVRVRQSDAGVTAIRRALFGLTKPGGCCLAESEHNARAIACEALGVEDPNQP